MCERTCMKARSTGGCIDVLQMKHKTRCIPSAGLAHGSIPLAPLRCFIVSAKKKILRARTTRKASVRYRRNNQITTPSSITTIPAEETTTTAAATSLDIIYFQMSVRKSMEVRRLHLIVTSDMARLRASPSAHFHFAKHLRHNATFQHRYSMLFET
jgi:hypothetical protein